MLKETLLFTALPGSPLSPLGPDAPSTPWTNQCNVRIETKKNQQQQQKKLNTTVNRNISSDLDTKLTRGPCISRESNRTLQAKAVS